MFSFSGALMSHLFLPLMLGVRASPCPVFILPTIGLVVQEAVVRGPTST